MKLDRQLQLQILEHLKDSYATGHSDISKQDFVNHPEYRGNIKYLYEHGLIHGAESKHLGKQPFTLLNINITKDGLDFLEDDGGISAILKTVTIKFDIENIRSLIEDKIISSSLPEPQRKTLIERVKSFSGDALKQIALKLLEKGLENPDVLLQLIKTTL